MRTMEEVAPVNTILCIRVAPHFPKCNLRTSTFHLFSFIQVMCSWSPVVLLTLIGQELHLPNVRVLMKITFCPCWSGGITPQPGRIMVLLNRVRPQDQVCLDVDDPCFLLKEKTEISWTPRREKPHISNLILSIIIQYWYLLSTLNLCG